MNKKNVNPIGGPVVCAVGSDYVICVPVKKKVLMKVEVDGEEYFCHSNGVRKSSTAVQKVTVPAKALNKAKKYKLTYEVINRRLPYNCYKQAPVSVEYSFRPIEKEDGIKIYHLSDVHGLGDAAIKAGDFFGDELDLLMLNGDISSSSNSADDIMLSYTIAHEITKGQIPCVISRGNHDLRGKFAEKLEEFLPTDNGKTYFTVKLGSLWILVLDCGEDKPDDHREYSGTVAFHQFRKEECRFIDSVIENSKNEYEADGVKHRFVLSHIPFCHNNTEECKGECPFDIEKEIYTEWCEKIRENIKPDFSLFGHLHITEICPPGHELDGKGLGGTLIIGGKPVKGEPDGMIGTALNIEKDFTHVRFTDSNKNVSEDKRITGE